jgi:hypothetical protein
LILPKINNLLQKKKIKNVNIILSTRIKNKLFIYSLFLLTKIQWNKMFNGTQNHRKNPPIQINATTRAQLGAIFSCLLPIFGISVSSADCSIYNWLRQNNSLSKEAHSLKGSPYFIRIGLALLQALCIVGEFKDVFIFYD